MFDSGELPLINLKEKIIQGFFFHFELASFHPVKLQLASCTFLHVSIHLKLAYELMIPTSHGEP